MSEEKQASNLVTSETLADFNSARLGLAEVVEEVVEEIAEVEEQEEEHQEESKKPNSKIEKRFSELTKQREEARKEAQEAKEATKALEARIKEIEAKSNPVAEVVPQEVGKPLAKDFTDAFAYAEALADWKVDQKLQERDNATLQSKVAETWQSRLNEFKKEATDFDEVVNNSELLVSDQVKENLLSSDVGPQVLLHLAKNPDLVTQLNGLNERDASRMFGRLEAKFEKTEEVKETKPVEISKAKAPISPIKGGNVPPELVNGDGEFTGSIAQYKAARKAGKI